MVNNIGDSFKGGMASRTEFLNKAYSRGWIQTIEDLETAAYGLPMQQYISKEDAPVLTSTTGFRDILYGQRLFSQIVTAANALGAMGTKPWDTSGYKAITAASGTTSPGLAEDAALPDTTKFTVANIPVAPTTSAITSEQSDILAQLNGRDNTIPWPAIVDEMGKEFINRLNRAAVATADTVPTTGIESLDRIIGSYAEIAYGKVADNAALDAGDLDIYGLDRDAAASYTDAYVSGQAFASGSRTLALSHIDSMFTNVRPYWEGPGVANKVIITGYDTLERIEQLLQAQQRFVGQATVQMTVNGIQTLNGVEGGFDVATYKGVPIIPDNTVLQDTLSRIMLLDLDNIHLGVLSPVQYIESGDFFANDVIGKEGMYYMHGEIVCTKFKSQGKVRDLQ
jgi:hypothetical protein